MLYHPHLMGQLAETRSADHHTAATRARNASSAQSAQPPARPTPSSASFQLDASPALWPAGDHRAHRLERSGLAHRVNRGCGD